jgi:phasin family protein
MYSSTQFAEFNHANVAQATKLAAIALENAEQVAQLNFNTAKAAIAQGIKGATTVAAAKEAREFLALPTRYAEAGIQNAVGYSRSLYEINTQAQNAYSTLAEEALADYTKGISAWVEKASESAPAGSEAAISAFKSSFAATKAAFDQFQKASQQVANIASASVRAAGENAAKVAIVRKGRKAA